MYGEHQFIARGDEMENRTSISVEGALGFLVARLVGEGVARSLEEQTRSLIARAGAVVSAAAPRYWL